MLRMDSELDSDGSHISATPPSSPAPCSASLSIARRREILLMTTKQRTKLKTSAPNSRAILRPKITKKASNSLPTEDPIEKEPQSPPPVLSNLPFQIKKTSVSRRDENAPDVLMLHGGRCSSKFASFSKNLGKDLKFEDDESEREVSLRDLKGKIQGRDLKGGSSELTSEAYVRDVKDDCFVERNVRKNVELIRGHVQEPAVHKRVRGIGEGNFVKLNINGRGRKKFKYKNKMKGFSSSSRRRKFFKKSKPSGGDESVVSDEEGFSMDIQKKGQERLNYDHSSINEAVMRVRNEISDENLVELLKLMYGYDSFRDGQIEAIKMVLSGKSTLLVLSTGAGKSLCYQLPALVLPGATLVVSPLVSLMIDQLKQLPPMIPGGLLCSSQTAEESAKTIRSLQEGEIKVLYVSPERFLNTEFISIFSGSSLLSLVVVDEAHCVSEWSHNFRPSYMRLRASLLRDRLNSGCILAMTATATTRTLCDVMHALEIPPTNLIKSAKLRNNLHLSVSINGNRIKDLMALLKSPPFVNIKCIIIYCKFQSETDMISKYLCDNISGMSYHSGISAKDRSRVQDLFCSGKIRVVVATVAFGMGLDKRDVGAVIHYGLPESLEEYVQEIGRAGRDGRSSYCHLFFDDSTYFKLRSLAYSDGVDEYAVNKLLSQIFSSGRLSTEEICSLVKESASRKFDMKAEVILTILTQLELGEVKYIHLLPQINVTCTLNFHKTSPPLIAARDPVVAAILKKSEIKDGQYVFHIPSLANRMRMQAIVLLNHLHSLKLNGEVTYELKDEAFCYKVIDVPSDVCSLATQLAKWLGEVETCKVRKMDAMCNAVNFAAKLCDKSQGCNEDQHSPCLQRKILDYFEDGDSETNAPPIQIKHNSPFLAADIKVFLQSNSNAKFTPRAVARIFHGLSSPAFPSAIWSTTHFWGRYVHLDFRSIMEAAKKELINFLGKDLN